MGYKLSLHDRKTFLIIWISKHTSFVVAIFWCHASFFCTILLGFGFYFLGLDSCLLQMIANDQKILNHKIFWSSFVEFCFVFFRLGFLFIANDSYLLNYQKVWCVVLFCVVLQLNLVFFNIQFIHVLRGSWVRQFWGRFCCLQVLTSVVEQILFSMLCGMGCFVVVVVVFGCLCCNWVAYANGGNVLGLTLEKNYFES
jgi:hypothetical protein